MNIGSQMYNMRLDMMKIGQLVWVGKEHRLLTDKRFRPTGRDRKWNTGATYVELRRVEA